MAARRRRLHLLTSKGNTMTPAERNDLIDRASNVALASDGAHTCARAALEEFLYSRVSVRDLIAIEQRLICDMMWGWNYY